MSELTYPIAGDCLLYRGKGFWSWAIRIKTFSYVSHCEVYTGKGRVVASRDGEGVAEYSYTSDRLVAILRPTEPFDLGAALAWFEQNVEGMGYDWAGLLSFFNMRKPDNKPRQKMFCSELAHSFYRAGGFEAFAPDYPPEKTSPGMFLSSPHFRRIWGR